MWHIYLHLADFNGKLVGKYTVHPMDPSRGFHPGWLYLSTDLGLTWSRAENFDGKNGCNHVAMSENGVTLVTGGDSWIMFGEGMTCIVI